MEVSQLGGRASTYEPKLDFNSDSVMDSNRAMLILNKISEELNLTSSQF